MTGPASRRRRLSPSAAVSRLAGFFRIPILPLVLALSSIPPIGCSGVGAPRTAAEQLERGEDVWERNCAQCHQAEQGIGSRLTPRALASYGTAEGLLAYNRDFMPYGAEGTLDPREYVNVTAFLLAEHGFTDGSRLLTPESAEGIRLAP